MPLDSSSTSAEVQAAYDDNASFEENGSVPQAQAFITACLLLLRRMPKMTNVDGQSVQFNADFVSQELQRARRFVAARSTGGSVRTWDMSQARE